MSNPYDLQHTSVRLCKEEAYTECAQHFATMRKAVMEGRGAYEEIFWDFTTATTLLWLLTRGNLRSKLPEGDFTSLASCADKFCSRTMPIDTNDRRIAMAKAVREGIAFADKLLNLIDQKGVIIS